MHLNPIVRLDHVSIIRNSNRILHDIDLCIDHGQHWAIIGQNGSGKTSLISIINGYHQPSEGKACVLGKNSALPTCGNCGCISGSAVLRYGI